MSTKIYDFEITDIKGESFPLKKYAGKWLLIVNTASECGFTPQYKELEELYQTHKDKLEILAFPCNQFGGQEPGDNQQIAKFCELNYATTFPLFSKIEVNGKNAHPLFLYLQEALPGLLGTKAIKWNFTKFLVDPTGLPVKRFAPNDKPKEIEKNIS
jgi:glutathione peroxidase